MSTTAQRLAEYEEAFKKSQAYDPNAFKNEFEKAYGEATNYNKDLIEQQSGALGEVQAVAPTLREKYMNTLVSDPTAQMRLIAQARQAPIASYGTAANLLNARGNRYQDILGKALGGYQTSAQQANTVAENAWRLYQDAVQQEQFNRQLARSGGGGGGSPINIGDLLKDSDGDGIPDISDPYPNDPNNGRTAPQEVIIDTGGPSNWTNVFTNNGGRTSITSPTVKKPSFLDIILGKVGLSGGSRGGGW